MEFYDNAMYGYTTRICFEWLCMCAEHVAGGDWASTSTQTKTETIKTVDDRSNVIESLYLEWI